MALQHLALDAITPAQLTRLVETKSRESAVIDYKQAFALSSDEQKREFLFDVASFANTDGGDLVYGIRAVDGIPEEIVGLADFIADNELLRMEDMLRSGIVPRLSGVGFQIVNAPSSRPVLIVRVPRGLATPHLVKTGSWTKFYGRNSAGKYELDVTEIRRAFLASEGVFNRLRDFRLERLRRLLRNDVGVNHASQRRLVLHVVPVATLREEMNFTLPQLLTARKDQTRPLGEINSWGPRYNFDGVLIESTANDRTILSSLQLFRNGVIEAVDASCVQHWEDKPILPAFLIEKAIREGFDGLLDYLKNLGVPPPFVICMSLLNVRGLAIIRGPQFSHSGITPIGQDNLILPEVTVPELPVTVDEVFRPLFDLIWNACGYSRSFHYDEHGKWNPKM